MAYRTVVAGVGYQEVEVQTETDVYISAQDNAGDELPGQWDEDGGITFTLDVDAYLNTIDPEVLKARFGFVEPTGDLAEEHRLRKETEERLKAFRTQYVLMHNWATEFLGSYKLGQVPKEKLTMLRTLLAQDAHKADDAGFDLNVAFIRRQTGGCVQGCASPVAQVLGKNEDWMRNVQDKLDPYDQPPMGEGPVYERFSLTAETLAVLLANRRNAGYLAAWVQKGTPERDTIDKLMNERAAIKPPTDGAMKGQDGLISYHAAKGKGHEQMVAAAYLDLAKRMIGCFTPASMVPGVVERLKAFGLWRWSDAGKIETPPLDPPFDPIPGSARAFREQQKLLVAEEVVRAPDAVEWAQAEQEQAVVEYAADIIHEDVEYEEAAADIIHEDVGARRLRNEGLLY